MSAERSVADACRTLVTKVGYSPMPGRTIDESIEDAVLAEVTSWGMELEKGKLNRGMIHSTAAIPDLFYPNHPFEVKVLIAKFVWLAYSIEYSTVGIPANAVEEFQHRLVTSQPQLHPLLDKYTQVLGEMRKFWHPLAADCIVTAGIQIIWASLLQHVDEYINLKPKPGGDRLPVYVRHRDGVSEALAYMTFTKEQVPDFYSYIQAIPEMMRYIDFTNDVFRIHSDDKANDYLNYVRERAAHAKKSHIDVLYDLGDEVVESQDKVDACLAGTGPAEEYWKTLKNGIIAMHLYHAPYGMAELGIGEEIPSVRKQH